MKIYNHAIIGLLLGVLVILTTQNNLSFSNLLPWLLGSVFIDLDHAIRYFIRHKTINLKKVIKLIIEDYKTNVQHFYPFHTLEFSLLFIFFMRRAEHYHYWLSAYFFHLFLDAARQRKLRRNYSWLRKWSIAVFLKTRYA